MVVVHITYSSGIGSNNNNNGSGGGGGVIRRKIITQKKQISGLMLVFNDCIS